MISHRIVNWARRAGCAAIVTVGCVMCAPASAYFLIDYNEQWLREDAYTRAMSEAKKTMDAYEEKYGKPTPKSDTKPSTSKSDVLSTGPQTMSGGEFIRDDVIKQMAAQFPAAQRKEAAVMFTQIISSFNDNVEKLYGVPKENVATGLVALLAGGYAAYHNKPFPERYVKPTVEQLGNFLRKRPEVFGNSKLDPRKTYQRAVGTGMLLQILQQQAAKTGKPEELADLKRAGTQIFREVLNTEPERVEFTSSGIKFR